jgi:hypothetical protein
MLGSGGIYVGLEEEKAEGVGQSETKDEGEKVRANRKSPGDIVNITRRKQVF